MGDGDRNLLLQVNNTTLNVFHRLKYYNWVRWSGVITIPSYMNHQRSSMWSLNCIPQCLQNSNQYKCIIQTSINDQIFEEIEEDSCSHYHEALDKEKNKVYNKFWFSTNAWNAHGDMIGLICNISCSWGW